VEVNNLPTSVQLHSDGRINVSLALKRGLPDLPNNHALQVDEFATDLNWKDCPQMNIVIMIVGSRGAFSESLLEARQDTDRICR
jgi:hypothetical protein